MSRKYWLSMLVGFLIFVVLYLYFTKFSIESFTDTPSSDTSNNNTTMNETTPSSAAAMVASLKNLLTGVIQQKSETTFTYIEDKTKIPKQDSLIVYLSCYSDFTGYDSKQSSYSSASNKWYNHVLKSDPFNIISSDALPASIRPPDGLPLLHKRLIGPRSDELNSKTYTLDAFSVSFFVKNEDFVFDGSNPIELFKIFVESPHYIKIFIEPNTLDSSKVNLVTIFGTSEDRYVIPIAKLALKAGGNAVLMTVSYNKLEKPSPKLYIYIGESQFTSGAIANPPNFVLGNSNIEINSLQTWDTRLYGFMYFTSFLTLDEHKKLTDYFNLQASGISSMIEQLKQLTEKQVEEINQLVESQSVTIDDIRKELEICKIEQSKSALEQESKETEKWMIKMNGYKVVSHDDLQKCSLLKIENVFQSQPETTGTTGTTPSSSEPFMISSPDSLKGVSPITPDLSKVTSKSDDLSSKIENLFGGR